MAWFYLYICTLQVCDDDDDDELKPMNETHRWAEMKSHTKMATYCSEQRHLVANSRAEEGGSGCQNVNKLVDKQTETVTWQICIVCYHYL